MDLKVVCLALCVAYVAAAPQQQQRAADDYQTRYNTLRNNLRSTLTTVLKNYNEEAEKREHDFTQAEWEYKTNVNEENLQKKVDMAVQYGKFDQQTKTQAETFKELTNELGSEKRQFTLFERPQYIQLQEDEMAQYQRLVAKNSEKLSTATVCKDFECGLQLYPDLEQEFRVNRDEDQLKRMWVSYRMNTGKEMRTDFEEMIRKSNRGAQMAGYKDKGQMDRVPYESPNLKGEVKQVWDQVEPLYKNLHAYVRSQLRKYYGEDTLSARGAIPAHLLGDMYAENWVNIYDLVEPFETTPQDSRRQSQHNRNFEVDTNMMAQGFTAKRNYELADNFFQSMNFPVTPDNFWRSSEFAKSYDRELICDVDSYEGTQINDMKVSDCRRPSFSQYMDAFRQMGKIRYAMEYKDQPHIFRESANPAFKEAIGETLALSAATPEYLKQQKLIRGASNEGEQEINFLLLQALYTLPRMGYSSMLENWRYGVFEGKTSFDNLNCAYVNDRFTVQGVQPPVFRSEDDFDAGSKLEVATNEEYIKNFISQVLKFQFHETLCTEAGQYSPSEKSPPLSRCNLYKSTPAGRKFKNMMKQGASKTPDQILKEFTGAEKMSAEALLDYFKPLNEWLQRENSKNTEYVGWEKEGNQDLCSQTTIRPSQRSSLACTFIKTPTGIECV